MHAVGIVTAPGPGPNWHGVPAWAKRRCTMIIKVVTQSQIAFPSVIINVKRGGEMVCEPEFEMVAN